MLRFPPGCLSVKHSLGESQPLRLVGWGVWITVFCSRHDGKAPEALVIVSFGQGLVSRHVVSVLADLEQETICRKFVEGIIASIVPVIDEGAKHGTSFPPCIASC